MYNGKHPVHLVSTDGGGVYGWVDLVNIDKATAQKPLELRVGARVRCNKTPLYNNSYGYAPVQQYITGDYTATRIIEGRAHGVMLNDVLGWVSPQDITVVG